MGNVNARFRSRSNRGESDKETGLKFFFLKKKKKQTCGNKKSEDEEDAAASSITVVPPELIMEILSWLPLKPLARAQLVCREWRALIQDHRFMEKHMNRNSYVYHQYNKPRVPTAEPGGSFCFLHYCDGLFLLKNNDSLMHLLWNPAARILLQLPTPHSGRYGFALSFAAATGNYKIFSFFKDKDSGQHGCQVLTPGRSMAWRRLTFPDVVNGNCQLQASVVAAGAAAHGVVLTKLGEETVAEIASVDVETEVVTLNRVPTGIFGDVGTARAIDCDGKLAFAVVVGQDLHLMVLQDYKNKRWCRNKEVIPLPFRKDEGFKGKVVILSIKQGGIWILLENGDTYIYTIETGKIRFLKRCTGFFLSSRLLSYKPSLVTFEGMQKDDELEKYRPRDLQLD